MKKILVLGAGMVAGPHINYLLDHNFRVTVASRTLSKAEALIKNHPNGFAVKFDITKTPENLEGLIKNCDLAVSLLPYVYHVDVARECIKQKKHMVTTSYVSPEMRELDKKAREVGITILNEIGVDPGIDHMSAKKIVDKVHKEGGEILSFKSYTGGLPAPDANTNPWGYKLSWSPRGVILAGRNPAKYLENGKIVEIPGEDLFDHYIPFYIPEKGPGDEEELGMLEGYPNRNSIEPYIDVYEIPETKTIIRGTLRNTSWCRTMKKVADIGYLNLNEEEFPITLTYGQLTNKLLGKPLDADTKSEFMDQFDYNESDDVVKRFDWMGLFGTDSLPSNKISPLDALCHQFEQHLQYSLGERDMLIMVHEFIYKESNGKKKKHTSTMIDYGLKNGPSSMSRTVGLPAAIGSRMILEGKIKDKGVLIPVKSTIYEPILKELQEHGIGFIDKLEDIK
ncbi:MAG: saccharopine dehydrogenase [Candidatus Heimdallarchaeota archaeon]|nr:saccharopine dehydrogenase [Candidatus Heimdallarchaeota archaeon]